MKYKFSKKPYNISFKATINVYTQLQIKQKIVFPYESTIS